MKKSLVSIVLSTLWITISEFLRNEILFKNYWVGHFQSLGLKFETLPVNGILWMAWSGLLALVLAKLLTKFPFRESVLTVWLMAFVMMWMTIFNLQVLPLTLLVAAVPLSLIEVIVAALIVAKGQK